MGIPASAPRIRRLEAVMLFVEHLERAKWFYGDVLRLEPEEVSDDFASYRAGAASIQLHPAGEPRPGVVLGRAGAGAQIQITFEVDDVDAAVEHLRALGVEVFDEPDDRPWGKRDAGVYDPDGNEIYVSKAIR